jgi:type IX secretion system PorP/SprF family membrane protein
MKKLVILIISIVAGTKSFSQDYNFSQFYELPLMRNPALAGIFDCNFRMKSVYRNQWQSVTVPYRTAAISAEMKFSAGGGNWHSLGTQVVYDIAGDSKLKKIQVLPVYTFHLEVAEDNYLSLGMMGGPVNTQFDPSKLTWDDQFVNGQYMATNPTRQLIRNSSRNYMELATGLAFSRPFGELGSMYIGASLYHVNRPMVSFFGGNNDKLDRRLGLSGGITVPSGAADALTFYGDAFFQGGHRQGMFGAMYTIALANEYYDDVNKTSLHLGGVYRWNDAIIPVLKLDFSQLSLGLSYDVNISKLKTASQSRGGFELTLSYRNCSIGAEQTNGLPCPKFGSIF